MNFIKCHMCGKEEPSFDYAHVCGPVKIKPNTNEQVEIGSSRLPYDVKLMLRDFIAQVSEKYDFKNGDTAAYLHLSHIVEQHLGDGKE